MSDQRTIGALVFVALCGCAEHNPAYLGGNPTPDLGERVFDLAMTLPDAAMNPTRDLSAVDLAAADLTPVAPDDLSPANDLFTPTISCNDMLCTGCCVAGVCHQVGDVCTATTVCAPGGTCAACGGLSQPCCSLNFCNGALVCSDGTCANCGTPGGPCCNGKSCTGGGCCAANVCIRSGKTCADHKICLDTACSDCGAATQTCCADNTCAGASACCDTANRTCVANGGSCGGGAVGSCNTGSCNGFGGVGQACFQEPDLVPNACSASGTVCGADGVGGNGSCQTCGADGQPCCGVSTCAGGGCCVDGTCHATGTSCGTAGGNCAAGACNGGSCGGLGQACCTGTLCTAPDTRCITPVGGAAGTCQPCGGKDQRCCVDPATAQNVFCEPPYTCTEVTIAGQMTGFCRK